MTIEEAYKKGFEDGLTAYAWWKDGTQFVGSCGTTLKEAKTKADESWNYDPPKEEESTPCAV
jgi:hypothetical protein